jgi:acyl-lipid omega-6 desaturase (Delta-12 desaturase)
MPENNINKNNQTSYPPIIDKGPRISKSVWQLINTLVPFSALVYLMYLSLSISVWITLGLSVIAAGFMVRIFIIQHDCGHGSFLKSRRWNNRIGMFCSLITLVPYYYWRRQHALHHSSSGNLDKRGFGDMNIYTIKEYLQLSRWDRIYYRAYRNPVVFLLLGPLFLFFVINRRVSNSAQYSQHDRNNVYITDAYIALLFIGGSLWLGAGTFLAIILPILFIAAGSGIWLFYIQHQFEHTYWKRGDEWNFANAAMQGSSFYKLPKLLQWFTGNIGYHHIHHLEERIPNYRLEQCYKEHPEYQDVYVVTLWSSLNTMFLSVWDEERDRLISFRELAKPQMR